MPAARIPHFFNTGTGKKAPSSVHQMATYYFYPVTDFHEIDGFLVIAPKPEVIDRYSLGVKCYVPPALSNGIWTRTLGLPVLEGLREVFFFFLSPSSFANVYRPQFLSYRDETLQAHYPRGDTVAFKKFWGSDPPGGISFPKFFSIF